MARPSAAAILLAGLALALVLSTAPCARAAGAERRVVVLKSGALALYDEVLEGFRAQTGFRPDERTLPAADEDEAAFVDAIRAAQPELLVTLGSKASEFALAHFEGTPILYAMVLDPRELRGPLVTGVPQTVPVAVQLRELAALDPTVKTVGVPYNPANSAQALAEAQAAAAALGLKVEPIRVENRAEAVGRVSRYLDDVQALWLPLDSTLINRQVLPAVAGLARRAKVAVVVHSAEIVRDGVLMAIEVPTVGTGQAVGEATTRFLDGEPIARLPVPPVKPRVRIDHDVARELGISEDRVRALEERFR